MGGEKRPTYGHVDFERASETRRALAEAVGLRARAALAASDPGGLWNLARVLLSIPRLRLTLTDSAAGRLIRDHLDERRHGIPFNRISQGVLALPCSVEHYLRGRHRQALRTNLNRASRQRMRSELVGRPPWPELTPWLDQPFPVRDAKLTLRAWLERRCEGGERWLAREADGRPVGLAVAFVDARVAYLDVLLSGSRPAGWLLHQEVVANAISHGASLLCVRGGNALLLDLGTQHFQRLLGYSVAHLSLHARAGADRAA